MMEILAAQHTDPESGPRELQLDEWCPEHLHQLVEQLRLHGKGSVIGQRSRQFIELADPQSGGDLNHVQINTGKTGWFLFWQVPSARSPRAGACIDVWTDDLALAVDIVLAGLGQGDNLEQRTLWFYDLTEQAWLSSPGFPPTPSPVSTYLRKTWLFAAALLRRTLPREGFCDSVMRAAMFLDGDSVNWTHPSFEVVRELNRFLDPSGSGIERRVLGQFIRLGNACVRGIISQKELYEKQADEIDHLRQAIPYSAESGAEVFTASTIKAEMSRLTAELLGNPFRPVTIPPEILAADDGRAIRLARQIFDDEQFDLLPDLAEVLVSAGLDEQSSVLAHCLSPGPHVRGCWVVDLILGKG